jgi:hypothetical protein
VSIFYQNMDVVVFTDTGTRVNPDELEVPTPTPTWDDDQWVGFVVRDAAGTLFNVTDNDGDTLVLDGDPVTGVFQIWRFVGGSDTFTIYSDEKDVASWKAAPNAEWWSNNTYDFGVGPWYLRDRNGDYFEISDTTRDTTPRNNLVLTVDGTPASGPFQIVTNPWLVQTLASAPTWSFDGPSGTTYGSVETTFQPSVTPGEFVLSAVSTSTTTGNTKEIRLDAQFGANAQVMLSNWRQVR